MIRIEHNSFEGTFILFGASMFLSDIYMGYVIIKSRKLWCDSKPMANGVKAYREAEG